MLDRLLSWAARRTKALAGWVLFRSGIFNRLRRDEAVIVLFHRVNDSYRSDVLTVTNRKFESFVRFFGRYFDVITLTELLRRLEQGESLKGKLVITFDDGYRGNATMAAPMSPAARHRLSIISSRGPAHRPAAVHNGTSLRRRTRCTSASM